MDNHKHDVQYNQQGVKLGFRLCTWMIWEGLYAIILVIDHVIKSALFGK